MKLFEYDNIHYEKNSAYPFERLNESRFIKRVFKNLAEIMRENFSAYEFFIFSNHTRGNIPESVNFTSRRKKVLLYFSDEKGEDPGYFSENYFAVFKSYIPTEVKAPNVFPLSLGYVGEVPEFTAKPINERRFNVFFRGNLNFPRIDFYKNFSYFKYIFPKRGLSYRFITDMLIKFKTDYSDYFPMSIIIFNSKFKSGFTPAEYGEVLSESKVVLCPSGFSSKECFRHFEAMRAGCIVVSEELPEHDFYKGSPIIQIKNWREGLAIVKDLLRDEEEMEKLQIETLNWWNNKCSERATANFIHAHLAKLS